ALTVTAIVVDPGDASLSLGEVAVLSATAQYSDGTSLPVSCSWTSSDESIVALSQPAGMTTLAEAVIEGTAEVTATYDGFVATAHITASYSIPTDPGVVYSQGVTDTQMGLFRYPSADSPPE